MYLQNSHSYLRLKWESSMRVACPAEKTKTFTATQKIRDLMLQHLWYSLSLWCCIMTDWFIGVIRDEWISKSFVVMELYVFLKGYRISDATRLALGFNHRTNLISLTKNTEVCKCHHLKPILWDLNGSSIF